MGSRARSAHSARVIDESGDHKNHSPDPDAAAAAATAARGKVGSAALVCAEFAAEHTFRERAFPPGAPLPPTRPIPVVVRRSLRFVAVVVVVFRAHSHAASFAGESRRHGERMRVRERRPTHTDPPIYLLIQCNSMSAVSRVRTARSLALFDPPSLLFLLSSLAYNRSRLVNTWRRR